MEFEAGLKLGLGSDRGPEFTTLEGWKCTPRVYYPEGLGVHAQSLLPPLESGGPGARVYRHHCLHPPNNGGEYTNHQNWPESSISEGF